MVNKKGPGTSPIAESGGFLCTRQGLTRARRPAPFPAGAWSSITAAPSCSKDGYSLHVCTLRPESRGTIRLKSSDPKEHPLIDANYLAERRDLDTLIDGVKMGRDIFAQSGLDPYRAEELQPGAAVKTDAELEQWIRAKCETIYHPVGSCKMGPASDPMAVVDNQLPRPRPGGPARGRRLGDADAGRRQHQRAHHHDRRAGRGLHAGAVMPDIDPAAQAKALKRLAMIMVFAGLMIGVGLPVLFMVFAIAAALTLWGVDAVWLVALAIDDLRFCHGAELLAPRDGAGTRAADGERVRPRAATVAPPARRQAEPCRRASWASPRRRCRAGSAVIIGCPRRPSASSRTCCARRSNSAGDAGLRRLVEGSALSVHLICDLTHRLLAASPPRVVNWAADLAEMRGQSLWRYATDEIRAAESRLGELGWYDDGVAQVSFDNGANDSAIVPIEPGVLVWERLQLSDGTLARLVTSL